MQDMFVGREKELHMIGDMIADPTGARHVVRLVGEAGLGKTWLLREMYRRYHNDPGILVVRIDYGEARPQSLPGLSAHVIEQFGAYMSDQQKSAYDKRMRDWEKLLQTEIDPDRLREEQNKLYHFGIDLIWQMSQEKRTLVLSDTVDSEHALEDMQRTNMLATNLPNTLMIFAGRPTPFTHTLYEELAVQYKRWTVHDTCELEPLTTREVSLYFEQLESSGFPATSAEERETIGHLTGGHPVLMAASAAWLRQHERGSLPLGTDSFHRQQFERALVEQVQTRQHPIDRALLALSYLNRRYDPAIIRIALDMEDQDALDALVTELMQHPFVRTSLLTDGGLLHSEIERLLLHHVWPAVDPDESLRRSLAQKVIASYYLPNIERLTAIVQEKLTQSLPTLTTTDHRDRLPLPDEYWPKRDLQMECLYYHFCISETDGWRYLNQLFDEALTYHYSLIQMDTIVQAVYKLAPQQVDSAQFQVRVAQLLFEKGEIQRAASIAERAVESADIQPADAAKAFIVLADSTTDPADKVTHFKVALEMAEAAEDPALELKIHNRLGLAYRRQGHWNEAEEAYLQVLHMLDEEQDPNQYAATLNNLAFVYMLNGNPVRADNLAEKALRMRREQGNIHGLGFSYSTRGRIAEALGDWVLALRYHRTAVDLCELVGDSNNAALMQVNVAAGECHGQKFETAHLLLSRALRSDLPNIRARALQQAARIDMDEAKSLTSQGAAPGEVQGKYEHAEKASRQALALARDVLDDHLVASVLIDLLFIVFLKDQCTDEDHTKTLQTLLKDHNYKHEKGRLLQLEGDRAFAQGNTLVAFDYYLQACDILADYSPASFRALFEDVRDKFFEVPKDQQRHLCQMIQTRYADYPPSSLQIALKELCIDVIVGF